MEPKAERGWEHDGLPAKEAGGQAARLTRLLRDSGDPLFARLRELLSERGVDVGTAVLAQLFPDDVDQEFGVLLASDRSVHTFVLHYSSQGDLAAQLRGAKIHEWTNISDHWQSSPYREYVREARELPPG
jgi:hypothetical protein